MENLSVKMEVCQFGEKNKWQKAIIILGFAGIGKTYCGRKYQNILDFDYLFYKYGYSKQAMQGKNFEELKGQVEGRSFNPLWPENFMSELTKNIQKYDVILIPANDEIISYLEKAKLDYILCYPSIESKSVYMKRYLERGTNQKWIEKMDRNFEENVKGFDARDCKKIILQKDETLEDKLIEFEYIKNCNE